MKPTAVGWLVVLNAVAAVAVASLKPFKIYDWTFGKDLPTDVSPRIYNGLEAREGQFKFMILTLTKINENVGLCSSSLVTPKWVLTAAHCVQSPDLDVILVGGRANVRDYVSERMLTPFDQPLVEKTYGVQERWPKRIYLNPKYDDTTYEHDVALIRTDRPFVIGKMVTTIPVSTQKITSRKMCMILGWGMVIGNKLPFTLNYIERKEVSTTELGCIINKQGRFVCLKADSRGICRGDSGSPLVCDGKVWGVASHLEGPSDIVDICGNQTEEYYTEIYYDSKWILDLINGGHASSDINLMSLLLCVIISSWISLEI